MKQQHIFERRNCVNCKVFDATTRKLKKLSEVGFESNDKLEGLSLMVTYFCEICGMQYEFFEE